MLGTIATALATISMASSVTTDWLDNGNVRVSVDVQISDPADAFPKGLPELAKAADEACENKGEPTLVEEAEVNGFTIFAPDRIQVTLSAVYACIAE